MCTEYCSLYNTGVYLIRKYYKKITDSGLRLNIILTTFQTSTQRLPLNTRSTAIRETKEVVTAVLIRFKQSTDNWNIGYEDEGASLVQNVRFTINQLRRRNVPEDLKYQISIFSYDDRTDPLTPRHKQHK